MRLRKLQAMRRPRRDECGQFSLRTALADHCSKELFWVDTMRSIVRTSVDAAWFFQVRAKIARRSFLLDDRFLATRIFRVVGKHFKRMQVDIAVGAIARAKPAADAPIFDNDFERIAAANGADRTADHAKRVAALPATCCNEIPVKAQAVAHETSDAVMRVRACVHASVAARAILQIENEQALRFHQTLREKLIDRNAV